MAEEKYTWTDNPTVSGVSPCDTDILNDCLMHLKYDKAAGGGLEICDIGLALYVDETKGLRRKLNGQIVDINTNTQAFLTRLLQIKTTNPDYFTTEANWQSEATLNVNGCVYKFVLNYATDGTTVVSVRLPKYPDYVEINSNSINSTAPVAVKGNGKALGVIDSTGNQARTLSCIQQPNYMNGVFLNDNLSSNAVNVGTSQTTYTISSKTIGVSTNANLSGLTGTATINSSLKQTKLKLFYFIQINTGQETTSDITNEQQLNNPFVFGKSEYSPIPKDNLSWLASHGQYNPKGTYSSYYDWVLENVNKGTENFKGTTGYCYKNINSNAYWWLSTDNPVVGMTVYEYLYNTMYPIGKIQSVSNGQFTYTNNGTNITYTCARYMEQDVTGPDWITDYDFVVNTNDETFRLPLLDGSEDLPGGSVINFDKDQIVKDNQFNFTASHNGWVILRVNSLTGAGSMIRLQTGSRVDYCTSASSGTSTAGVSIFCKRGELINVGSWGTWSAVDAFRLERAKGNGTLYYYVGETVQNADLIDAGRCLEVLANKADITYVNTAVAPLKKAYIIDSYSNGTSGYITYSNGLCEQWGRSSVSLSSDQTATVQFLKAYKNANVVVVANNYVNQLNGHSNCSMGVTYPTATKFTYSCDNADAGQSVTAVVWRAVGFINV